MKTDADRVAHLRKTASEMISDKQQLEIWLHTPLDIFSGNTPLEHVRTEAGLRDTIDLIGRIRHGAFS